MIYNFLPVISSLIFILILWNIFLTKKRLKNTREKYFIIYMVLTTILLVFELVMYIVYIAIDNILLHKIFFKLHFVLLILEMYGIESYFIFIIFKLYDKSIIKSMFANASTIFSFSVKLLSIIILFILPYETYDFSNLKFTSGVNFNLFVITGIIAFANILVVFLLKSKSSMNDIEKGGTSFAIFLFGLIVILQILIPNILFLSSAYAIINFALFVNSENPDLRYIELILKNKEEIESSNKSKNNFLSNMTDEINIPLGLINSLCRELFVSETYNKEKYKDILSKIQLSSNSLLESVNNILNIAEIESGNQKIYEKNYKVEDLINDLSSLAVLKIGAKPIKFEMNISNNIPSILYGDISKIYLSISNIIINAAKYTETGKIIFSLESRRDKTEEELIFKVSDTGIGIKKDDNIFQKSTEDNGIGLSISKQYIENMGGKIWYESDYMVGSKFYVSLKQRIVNEQPIGTINTASEETKGPLRDCSNIKALIVDDSKISAKLTEYYLKRYNMQTESVYSGMDCITKIKMDEQYDVIFLDLTMPDVDGLKTMKVIKSLKDFKIPKIIALTANAMIGMREICLQDGFDEYISKPVDLKELDRVINKL